MVQGFTGNDAKEKTTTTGKKFCTFSVADSSKRDGKETTNWFTFMVYGKLADVCLKYIKKGTPVFVMGTVSVTENGNYYYANEVTFLSRGKENAYEDNGPEQHLVENNEKPSAPQGAINPYSDVKVDAVYEAIDQLPF